MLLYAEPEAHVLNPAYNNIEELSRKSSDWDYPVLECFWSDIAVKHLMYWNIWIYVLAPRKYGHSNVAVWEQNAPPTLDSVY